MLIIWNEVMQLKEELLQLRAELDELRREQGDQQQNLAIQLNVMSDKLNHLSHQVDISPLAINQVNEVKSPADVNIQRDKAQRNIEVVNLASSPDKDSQLNIDPWTATELPPLPKSNSQQAKVSASTELLNQLSQSAEQLSTSLSSLLGPFAGISNQVRSFYQHYQEKGQGPVFLMTVAGIITLTLGFGYLLQYSINNWFSEFGKALFGFASANAFIALGAFIHKKRAGMQDFASGLIGLGLILNYLSTYFIGPYFGLIPTGISFILLFLITLAGFGISMKFEAKVVSIISLIGGSLAPIMLISGSQAPLLYLPYLLLIGCCALIQSRKLNWPPLIEVTSLLHIACIEAFILYQGHAFTHLDWQIILGIASISGSFYLYGFTGIYWLLKSQRSVMLNKMEQSTQGPLTSRILALPFALIALVLVATSQFTLYNGEVFLLNSLICIGLFVALRQHLQLRGILLVFAGSFAGFAALNLISHEYLGLVLLLEGSLLLWLGAKDKLTSVRAEAYVLLALGFVLNIYGIAESIGQSRYSVDILRANSFTLILLLLTTATLYSTSLIMHKFLRQEDDTWGLVYERRIWRLLKELLSVGYTATILFITSLISYVYTLNILPLISLFLLYLAAKDKLKFTELLAWLLILPLLTLIGFGIFDSGSFSFGQQALYAKIARIEVFVSLILAYYWYRRHFADSKLIKFTALLQLVCLIALPILFIPKVLREFENYLSIAIWMSCFISLLLARFIKHKALILEAKILTLTAISITALSCLEQRWQGLIGLTIGAVMMSILLVRYLSLDNISQRIFKFQWQLSPFYFGLITAVITQSLVGNWGVVAAVLTGYFVWLISLKPIPDVLKSGASLPYGLTVAFGIAPLLIHTQTYMLSNTENLLYCLAEVASLAILGWLVLQNGAVIRAHRSTISLAVLQWGWHILLALSYLVWSDQLPAVFAAPISAILLVIHGSWLMFISLKPKQTQMVKLAGILFALSCMKVIFIDMATFEIIQKVVAFMVIGAILLCVSYFYQKARNRIS
ncbi:MAG: hypothetical protein ACI8SK_000597 [Shewanella sp.]|jgi:hypothetical protein